MEDSSWEGWTTPAPPPGPEIGFPFGRKLPGGPPSGWVGEIRSLPKATDDTIKYASRMWPQARPEDFERDRSPIRRARHRDRVRARPRQPAVR